MRRISVFDILKIGVGPSSSHTMGPWRATEDFLHVLRDNGQLGTVKMLTVDLFGSLAKTGKGHGTDIAVMMGLMGHDPVTCDTTLLDGQIQAVHDNRRLLLGGEHDLIFDPTTHIRFQFDHTLPRHPNGMTVTALLHSGEEISGTYYSVGGGFIERETDAPGGDVNVDVVLLYPCDSGADILRHCTANKFAIWEMVLENEKIWRPEAEIRQRLMQIVDTMTACAYRGCQTGGELPGGLRVKRRAPELYARLIGDTICDTPQAWMQAIRSGVHDFQHTVKWVSCIALAVNEENASFGRVVTAPTNGAAGVIPAVLLYYRGFCGASDEDLLRFLLVAGEIGSLFKKGATISAAQGGCQAEIGVSSAMAAAALTECMGGTVEQALMAAEIAMEHHLGLTCDPISGLVQIPCIERNAMGAMKAITAANLALDSTPQHAKVSLDVVIKTMWETARDMSDKYKETSEGGLAVHIPVNVIEC